MKSKVIHLPRMGRAVCAPKTASGEVVGRAAVIPIHRPRLVRPALGDGSAVRWESDPDDGNTVLSAGWPDLFGADTVALMATRWDRHIHPDDRFRAAMEWLKGRITGQPYASTARALVHGVYRPVVSLAFPIRDASGRIVRWEGYCQLLEDDRAVNF